jgi:RNA polymerase sigma-70 factor (ECF subfamily)
MLVKPTQDELLVDRAKEGDLKAFDLLVTKYRCRVLRLVIGKIRNSDEADDLVQETFMRAYRAVDGFRGDASFYTWLYTIALNVVKSYGQRPEIIFFQNCSPLEDCEDEHGANGPIDFDTPESLLMCKQMAGTISKTVEKLPLDFQAALSLREIDGLSYEKIADRSKCPIGTVRSRIFRSREVVADTLVGLGYTL